MNLFCIKGSRNAKSAFWKCFLGSYGFCSLAPSTVNPLWVCRVAFLRWFWEPCNYASVMGEKVRVGHSWRQLQLLLKERETGKESDTAIIQGSRVFWRRPEWVWKVFLIQWSLRSFFFFFLTETVHRHMQHYEVEYLQFAFRWMNNLLMRELPLRCTIRLWDTYQVHTHTLTHLCRC